MKVSVLFIVVAVMVCAMVQESEQVYWRTLTQSGAVEGGPQEKPFGKLPFGNIGNIKGIVEKVKEVLGKKKDCNKGKPTEVPPVDTDGGDSAPSVSGESPQPNPGAGNEAPPAGSGSSENVPPQQENNK